MIEAFKQFLAGEMIVENADPDDDANDPNEQAKETYHYIKSEDVSEVVTSANKKHKMYVDEDGNYAIKHGKDQYSHTHIDYDKHVFGKDGPSSHQTIHKHVKDSNPHLSDENASTAAKLIRKDLKDNVQND